MSDAEDMKVDDMLEAVFKGNGKKDPSSGKMNGPFPQGHNASPEPQNGTEKRAEESVRKRRPSRSPSRSRSRTPKPKKKRSRSKDKESRRSRSKESRRRRSPSRERSDRSSRRDRGSDRERDRERRRSPSPGGSDADRDRSRRKREKERERSVSKSRSRSPRRSPPRRSRSRSPRRRDDRRDRDRDRRSPVRRERTRSPPRRSPPRRDNRGGGGGDRRYDRSPPRYGGRGGRDRGGFGGRGGGRARQSIERARSVRSESPDIPAEERDQRTVFCMQLAQTINAKDLEKFFSSVGRVRDVRLIVDSKTRRSKGISYVEFYELEAVPLALGLHGQKLKNCPMNIQPTHAEKNRAAMAAAGAVQKGPMRLYVGSLHFNITEDMLKDIFEPFGKLDSVQLMMDPESGRSRGYAFITFRDAQDAKRAMEQLNGFELAGRAMKIGHVTDRSDNATQGSLDYDDTDRAGFDLGPTGRLQLMAKLAEGTGMKIPQASAAPPPPAAPAAPAMAPIATQCFMLSNMFDPKTETEPTWASDLKQEVIDECSQYGGVVHVHVDADAGEGNVYVKSVSIAAATLAVQSLHGRFFAGRMITVNYIPTLNYHQLFPEAMKSHFPLAPSQR